MSSPLQSEPAQECQPSQPDARRPGTTKFNRKRPISLHVPPLPDPYIHRSILEDKDSASKGMTLEDKVRQALLAEHRKPLINLHGMSGTGKSSLAVHVVQNLTERDFPDGILWGDLENLAPHDQLRSFLTALDTDWRNNALTLRTYDTMSGYEMGLDTLKAAMDQQHPRYSELLVYEQRLGEVISKTRRYGDTEVNKSERAEIIDHLNDLTQKALGVSFNELSQLGSSRVSRPEQADNVLYANDSLRDIFWKRLLNTQARFLIVLDNVKDDRQIAAFLPSGAEQVGRCRILAISIAKLANPPVPCEDQHVENFNEAEATQLFC